MREALLSLFRSMPAFKGKLRIGKVLFKNKIGKRELELFKAHFGIQYKIPNTIESLGVELMINGVYERKIVRFLNSHLKQGDIYFDVGANIGAMGLPILKNNTSVKYFGFEASPIVFEYLKYNFEKNKISDFRLYNKVVYENENDSLKFYQSEYYGKGSLSTTYSKEFILVNSLSLDLFCELEKISRINWIKIDVQGFELSVFKGMKRLLTNKQVNNILFEFEYWAEEDAGVEKGAAQKYLISLGYELFDLKGRMLDKIITLGRSMIWAKPMRNII
jgi:FkbM family methyltransferase